MNVCVLNDDTNMYSCKENLTKQLKTDEWKKKSI